MADPTRLYPVPARTPHKDWADKAEAVLRELMREAHDKGIDLIDAQHLILLQVTNDVCYFRLSDGVERRRAERLAAQQR